MRRAIGGDQAGVPNRSPGTRDAQAGGLEIWPGLLRAIAAHRADVHAVALGEGVRLAGFHLWGKSRKYGEGGSGKRSDNDG